MSKEDIHRCLDGKLLNPKDPLHLESMVGGILAIYGLLCCNELLRINPGIIEGMVEYVSTNDDMECNYPWATKTRKIGFSFHIPAKYRYLFVKYINQLDDKVSRNNLFSKT